jgi:hypothetical protein
VNRRAVFLSAAALLVTPKARAELRIQELKWLGKRAAMPLFRAAVAGDFNGEVEARFAMRIDPIVYKPRLAFYRVATVLGSSLVPRTEVYQVRLGDVLRALARDPHGVELLRSGVTVYNDGTVTMLLSEAVTGGHDVDMTAGTEVSAWRNWAEGREPLASERQKLMLAYVEALVLDFVTGTVGRLIDRVRAFDRIEADRTLREGAFTSWLVATRPLSEMMERRRAIVSLVDARMAEHGETELVLIP